MNMNSITLDRVNDQYSIFGNDLVIEIPDSLTVIEAQSFRQAFKPIFESHSLPQSVTLDFTKTTFLDSSGIGALASIIKMSKIAGIGIKVAGMTRQVHTVLKMTRLDTLISIDNCDDYIPKYSAQATGEIPEFSQ